MTTLLESVPSRHLLPCWVLYCQELCPVYCTSTGDDSRWMLTGKTVSAPPACPSLLQAADQVKDRAREGFDASPAPALKDAVSAVREAVPGPKDAARQSSESASNTADQLQQATQDAGQAADSVTPDIRPDKQVGSHTALALPAPSRCNHLGPAL